MFSRLRFLTAYRNDRVKRSGANRAFRLPEAEQGLFGCRRPVWILLEPLSCDSPMMRKTAVTVRVPAARIASVSNTCTDALCRCSDRAVGESADPITPLLPGSRWHSGINTVSANGKNNKKTSLTSYIGFLSGFGPNILAFAQ